MMLSVNTKRYTSNSRYSQNLVSFMVTNQAPAFFLYSTYGQRLVRRQHPLKAETSPLTMINNRWAGTRKYGGM